MLHRFDVWNLECSLLYDSDQNVLLLYVYRLSLDMAMRLNDVIIYDIVHVRLCTRFGRP